MILLILIVMSLLILTKLADVVSTLQKIGHYSQEANPLTRKLMEKFGSKGAIWMVFGVSLGIIAGTTYFALQGLYFFRYVYVVYGVLVSLVQAAAAVANWTGRPNAVTRAVMRVYAGFRRFVSG